MEPADLELLGMQNVERSSPLSRFREVLAPKSFLRLSRSPRPHAGYTGAQIAEIKNGGRASR
jgi:hypothetical protein